MAVKESKGRLSSEGAAIRIFGSAREEGRSSGATIFTE
jgi:hypothetical protein